MTRNFSYEREVKVDATVCRTSDLGEDLRSFSQCPIYPDPEPCNELHQRRPSQEVYHRLCHGREAKGPGSENTRMHSDRRDSRVLPAVPPLQGGRRGHRQLRLVRGARGAPGREGRAGQSQEAQGDCREHQEDRQPGCPGLDRIPGPGHDPRVLPAHAPAAAAPGLGPPPPVSPGPDYLGPQQDPTHPQQLQRRPQRPVLGELRPGLLEGGPPQRRGSVCDETALGRMAGPPGSAAGGEQEAQGLRGQGAAAGSGGPREILMTAPGVGPVTAEVVLSELGDISRFRNAKTVCAYAGLVPVVRQSGERKSKDMKITKEGSGLLRWALVEAAWRLVGNSPKWAALFARLMHRSGKKRAIVAVARKLLCVLYAMLKTSTPYQPMMAA